MPHTVDSKVSSAFTKLETVVAPYAERARVAMQNPPYAQNAGIIFTFHEMLKYFHQAYMERKDLHQLWEDSGTPNNGTSGFSKAFFKAAILAIQDREAALLVYSAITGKSCLPDDLDAAEKAWVLRIQRGAHRDMKAWNLPVVLLWQPNPPLEMMKQVPHRN